MSSRSRASVLALSLLLWASPAWATWSQVSQVSLGATGITNVVGPTASINTTGANVIVCPVAFYDGINNSTSAMLSDSAANTWSMIANQAASGDGSLRIAIYYVIGPTTSASHTFTWTGTVSAATAPAIVCYALTQGSNPTFVTSVSGNTTSGTGPTTIQAGSIGNANDLVVSGVAWYTNNSQSINSSFSTPVEVGYSSGNHLGLAGSWKQVAGAVNPTWSVAGNNSTTEAAQSVSFTGTAGGASPCRGSLLLLGAGGCE